MKKSTLIKWHVYCGLFTSFYLIAFGISSIILNHKMKAENTTVKQTWSHEVEVERSMTDRELAEDIRNQLGLMGWTPPWQFKKEEANFKFTVTSFAKTSRLSLDLNSGKVEVAEIPKGFVAIVHGLHFFNGRIPNTPFFLKTWRVYQWLTLLTLFFSLILGLWLWIKYSHKTWELYFFGGLFIISFLVMLLL